MRTGTRELVAAACTFGNSLTLPLVFLSSLLPGAAYDRAVRLHSAVPGGLVAAAVEPGLRAAQLGRVAVGGAGWGLTFMHRPALP